MYCSSAHKSAVLLAMMFFLYAPAACTTNLISPTSTAQSTAIPPSPSSQVFPAETVSSPVITPTDYSENDGTELSNQQTVKIFLVVMGDNGQSGKYIGCGDSLVPVEIAIEPTTAVLRAALTELLNLSTQMEFSQSGLYNALYLSELNIAGLNIVNRKAVVRLSGTMIYGGECDIPRIEEQLRETVVQFSTIDEAEIFVNEVPLDELLSLEG